MSDKLKNTSSFDWQCQFETRAFNARDWVVIEAKKLPLQRRREIVRHIKEGMEEASFHKDIAYGASQIRYELIHDLWSGLKGTSKQIQNAKQKIEDFSMWAATQAPAHQSAIQNALWDIVPEDIPEQEKKKHEAFFQMLGRAHTCC